MGSRCPRMECSGQACTPLATSRRPRSPLHSTKRSGVSAWSLCWVLAGARRITLWVVLNLINLIVSADGGCRRTVSPRRCLLVLGSNEQKLWFATEIAILGVIMESIRHSPSDCREKGNARKDCSKLSAWLVGCERCKTGGARDTGKLECAPNRPGGQGYGTTGGEEALHQVTAIDSGVSSRLHRGIQKQGNARQSLSMCRFNFLDRLSPPTLVSAMLEAKDRPVHRLHHRNDGSR